MPSEFIDARNPVSPASVHADLFDGDLLVGGSDEFRVGLLIPMCGSAGIWGPSCIASVEVAAYELNRRDGTAGRHVRLILIDSAIEASTPVEDLVDGLIESRSIDAIVEMHISSHPAATRPRAPPTRPSSESANTAIGSPRCERCSSVIARIPMSR